MRDILTTRITNYRTQQSASGEAFQVVNGCAAHHSGQVLTIQGKTGSPFREITTTLMGKGTTAFPDFGDAICFYRYFRVPDELEPQQPQERSTNGDVLLPTGPNEGRGCH